MSQEPDSPRKPRVFRGTPRVDEPQTSTKAAEPVESAGEAPPQNEPQARTERAKPRARVIDEQIEPEADQILHKPRDKQTADEPFDPDGFDDDDVAAEGERTPTMPTLKDIKSGFQWTAVLFSTAGALAAMSFTAWLSSFVTGLVERQDWIGWLALALVVTLLFSLTMIILRELIALARLNKIGLLREHATRALLHDDRAQSEQIQSEIQNLFHGRPALAWGLATLKEHRKDVLSARDRLVLIERSVVAPLDHDARRIVADSAKRVSVMTALSPFVFLDMMLVATENFRMLRRLMALYGGRPGLFSQFKLIQMMIANLALTGGIAVGADLLGHVMGRQVATRLAGRVGEGFVNGSLTARLGITATKLIRPLPYIEAKPTSISAFVKELTRGTKQSRV